MRESIVIAVSVLLGGLLGRLLHLPSGVMVGGMVAGLLVKGATLGELPSGELLSIASQLLVGDDIQRSLSRFKYHIFISDDSALRIYDLQINPSRFSNFPSQS